MKILSFSMPRGIK